MKKLVLIVSLVLAVGQFQAPTAQAAGKSTPAPMASSGNHHGPAGCGLGAMMFQGKDGVVMHVLAATFNSSSGNQTFAMSSGTLGCEDAATAKVAAVSFIQDNKF